MTTATDTTDRIKELRTTLEEKTAVCDEIIKAIDVEGADVTVSEDQAAAFRKANAEAMEIKGMISMLESQNELHQFLDSPAKAAEATAAAAAGFQPPVQRKSIGELFTDSEEYKAFRKAGGYTMQNQFEIEGMDLGSMWAGRGGSPGQKDIFTQTPTPSPYFPFGFAPIEFDPNIIPLAQRTVRVRDLFPVQMTTAAVIEFFRVTGFVNNASTVPERTPDNLYGMKPHSNLTFVGTAAPVRTIAHWETAHRNTLDDVQQLQGIINNELLYGLRLAEDAQILNGSGAGEDLLGILNTPGIQGLTRATGDNFADAIRRAMTRSFLAYYEPTGVVIHPIDWEGIELLKTTFGQYILSTNVAVGAVKQVWRLPVVDTPAIAEGTGLIGAFGIGATLYDRMQANIRIAEQHADLFVRNAVLVLAEERIGVAVKRPESFVKITF